MVQKLPQGWAQARLGQIVEVNPRLDLTAVPEGTPVSFVRMAAVEEESGRVDVSTVRPLSEVRRGYTAFREGDVLFAKITPCMENGKSAVVRGLTSGMGFGSTEFHVLRTREGADADLLRYFLVQRTYRNAARASMTGTAGQLRVPASYLSNTLFSLPPLAEQRRIVAAIEEQFTRLDAGVAALKRSQAALKRYRAAVLKAAVEGKLTASWRTQHADVRPASELLADILAERRARWEADQRAKGKDLAKARYEEPQPPQTEGLPALPQGWVWATVEQIGPPDRPCAYGVLQPGQDVASGVPLVRVGDVNDGQVRLDGLKRIAAEIADAYPRTRLRGGEVLITLVGTIGRTAVVPQELAGANTARAVGVIPLTELVFASWVEIFLRNPDKVREMTQAAHEVARKTLNLEDVRTVHIALPSVNEQEQIVAQVEQRLSVVGVLEATIAANLKRAERLRQAILERAFTGRLVPQDPADEPASALLERIRAEQESDRRPETAGRRIVAASGAQLSADTAQPVARLAQKPLW